MTTAAKARVVRAALVLLALWPVVQHALVRGTEVSPWKLAGWGMYAAPQDNVGVVVLVEDPRTSENVVLPREALPQEFWAALDGHPTIRQDATLVAFRDILLAGQPPVWAREPYYVLPAAALLLEPAADEPTSP